VAGILAIRAVMITRAVATGFEMTALPIYHHIQEVQVQTYVATARVLSTYVATIYVQGKDDSVQYV
jgi:hypothetical protein